MKNKCSKCGHKVKNHSTTLNTRWCVFKAICKCVAVKQGRVVCTGCNQAKPDVKISGGYRKAEYLGRQYSDDSVGERQFLQDWQNPSTWERITEALCPPCEEKAYEEPDPESDYYCTY